MNEQLIKLTELGYDLNDFYAITIYPDMILLQGHLEINAKSKYESIGFAFIQGYDGFNQANFLEANKDGIEITLTY